MSIALRKQMIAALAPRNHDKKELLLVVNYLKLNIKDKDINKINVINKINETLSHKNILIINIKTTGFDTNNDRIVEFACQLCNEKGQLLEKYNFYITLVYFANLFLKILEKADIIVAHNYKYSYEFIKEELVRLNRNDIILELDNKQSFCTLKEHNKDNIISNLKLDVVYKKIFNKDLDETLQHVIACKHIYFKNCNL